MPDLTPEHLSKTMTTLDFAMLTSISLDGGVINAFHSRQALMNRQAFNHPRICRPAVARVWSWNAWEPWSQIQRV